ncbi:unnamed protein product [Moneuplotes crassus]|uniref:Uncharacterized protein n=1 Tax=Euplotes crassus TaxID=5936 RepID=A0AAD1UQ40_EUPCR|nr:unnamed protein product [Moneuplotes crassus]
MSIIENGKCDRCGIEEKQGEDVRYLSDEWIYPDSVFASASQQYVSDVSKPKCETINVDCLGWGFCEDSNFLFSQSKHLEADPLTLEKEQKNSSSCDLCSNPNGILHINNTNLRESLSFPGQRSCDKQDIQTINSMNYGLEVQREEEKYQSNIERERDFPCELQRQHIPLLGQRGHGRTDVLYKPVLRFVRRFFKNTFKLKNPDVVQKRYSRCSAGYLYEKMQAMLEEMIPQENIAPNLIYYTIGLVGAKCEEKLPCSILIKSEIKDLKSCSKAFSNLKFAKALESESLQTLCWYLIQQVKDPSVSLLKNHMIHSPH